MATVTGLTAARMQQIINDQMATADIVGDDLVITTNDDRAINAGNVRGPMGSITGYPHLFDPKACRWGCHTTASHVEPSSLFYSAMVLDNEIFNVNGFTLDGGRIVVPEDGVYHVDGQVALTPTTATGTEVLLAQASVVEGGSGEELFGNTTVFTSSAIPSFVTSTVSGDLQANAGDHIELAYNFTFAYSLYLVIPSNYLSVHRVA